MSRYSHVGAALVALVCVHAAASLSHAAVIVNFDPGTTNTTTALTGFTITGNDMAGMKVTAYFSNATTETVTWAGLGGSAGSAVGTGWSLAESGDTFSSNWTLSNASGLSIDRLLIDAGPGDTVFDTNNPNPGSPGSSTGNTFSATTSLTIEAFYRDQVAIGLDPPVGDLFRRLDLFFNTPFTTGSTLNFQADTDGILFAGDLTPTAAPEPTTYLAWLVMGLTAAVVNRRYRHKK